MRTPTIIPALLAVALLGLYLSPARDTFAAVPPAVTKPIVRKAPADRPRLQARPTGGVAVPSALTKATRSALLRKLIVDKKKQDALAQLPATLEMRLTPMHPSLDNGARIEAAAGIDYTGPSLEWPEGAYWMIGKANDWYYPDGNYLEASTITIRVPTEPGKMHVVDCRALVWDYWGYDTGQYNSFVEGTVKLRLGGTAQTVKTVQGHILGVLHATEASSKIEIEYADPEHISYHGLIFWGCDVGKVG